MNQGECVVQKYSMDCMNFKYSVFYLFHID